MPEPAITYALINGVEAAAMLSELRQLYREVYAEPPYQWGEDHVTLFADRFQVQSTQPGFALTQARHGVDLAGYCFGVTLQPTTPWWQHLLTPLPPETTTERPGRTLAVVEFLVLARYRRQRIGKNLHDMLLDNRPEERATLTVLPAATAAQHAYDTWGWDHVAQKRNPLPGSPIFDVLIKQLHE